MTKAYDSLQITVVQLEGGSGLDPVTGGGCSLSWDIVDEDNNNPECYLVGSSYRARLYESPRGLNVIASNSNGHINFSSHVYPQIQDEYIEFSGSDEASFDYPYWGSFLYEQIGKAYNKNGAEIFSLTIKIASGSKNIKASEDCYAIFKVSYTAIYSRYAFSGTSDGKLFLFAITECGENFVVATEEVNIYEDCTTSKEEDEKECLDISIEVDTSSEEGNKITNERKKLIRIYGASGPSDICVGVTLGSIKFSQGREEKLTEEIKISEGRGSTNKPIESLIDWEKTGGHFNSLKVINKEIEVTQSQFTSPINCVPYGYGTAKVTYISRWLEYIISSARIGSGMIIVTDQVNEDCKEVFTTDYEIGGEDETPEEGQNQYDIAVVYKDFVTGEPIVGAQVSVDGESVGSTDESGKIIVKGITSEIKHTIKASKPGYLNTDSDSLANDEFIIREK